MKECPTYKCIDIKCPGFYCIPWRYVCNGHWQCPGGLDERNCKRRSCPGRFKCKDSVICLSVDNICDGITDCPKQDDEFLCFPEIPSCSEKCKCFVYTIRCSNHRLLLPKLKYLYPYTQVLVIESSMKDLTRFFNQFNTTDSFILYENEIEYICSSLKSYVLQSKIVYLELSKNDIRKLTRGCFNCDSSS